MKNAWISLAGVCALVCAIYAHTAHSGYVLSPSLSPAESYYNLLVQGFRAGQLNVKKQVPVGFVQLAAPYDPTANAHYGLLDLSYYKGKLYLYYGVTPAVLLFWPYVALTGRYLPQKDAVLFFCVIGFLSSVGLFVDLWRRYFAELSVATVAAGILALGLAICALPLLARCDVWEVSISCGYALSMLALAALWKALHEAERKAWWLAAASLAYGLAVGARPSLLCGAAILLVPVVEAWHGRQNILALLLAAIVPMALIVSGLLLYNALRFDNPFEFGLRYALSGDRLSSTPPFSMRYLWFHFRVYFLGFAGWSVRFPFVRDITVPPPPIGHGRIEHPFGVLTNIPVVWLALAVPLAWRGRSEDRRSNLGAFLLAVAILFGTTALTLCLFFSTSIRYEVEFLPALVLLAVTGILGLERAWIPDPARRRALRWGWSLLLGFSVVFNLLASVERCAESHGNLGVILVRSGRIQEGIAHYEQALRLNPDYAEAHNNLGLALMSLGRVPEAVRHFERALTIRPDSVEEQDNLGVALARLGETQDAIAHYKQALTLNPDYVEAHNNLGLALMSLGRVQEASGHFEQALTIKPDYAEAHDNLGNSLLQEGRASDAIREYEIALRIDPDSAATESNLGLALARLGKLRDAIAHYQQALRIDPKHAEAHYNLANALQQTGNTPDAIVHYQDELGIDPLDADGHGKLGAAFMAIGKPHEAVEQLQQALGIKPDLVEAQNNLAWLLATLPQAEGGDPHRAVSLARRACELTGNQSISNLDTLAVAYAAAGQFDPAVSTAQKAIDLARSARQTQLAKEIEARLELYRNRRAYSRSAGVTSTSDP
jgi:tetratricopeptide (TPR) repeat protein